MSAKENFEKLYKTVEDIKTTFDEREHVKEELAAVREEAKQFFDDTVKNYRAEEEKLNQLIEQEKEKCARLAAEFRALSAEKTKCRMQCIAFQDEERLKELTDYLGTYELTMRGMEEARKSIVISARAQRLMEQYQARGTDRSQKARSMADTLSMLLGKLKGEDALNCLASFEYIPSQWDFMPAEMKEWNDMRMEDLEEAAKEMEEWKWGE